MKELPKVYEPQQVAGRNFRLQRIQQHSRQDQFPSVDTGSGIDDPDGLRSFRNRQPGRQAAAFERGPYRIAQSIVPCGPRQQNDEQKQIGGPPVFVR